MKARSCNRCSTTKAKVATRSEVISLGESRWLLQLCAEHAKALDRDFYAWGRLGEPLEGAAGARTISAEYQAEAARVAELRYEQKAAPLTISADDMEVFDAALRASMSPLLAGWKFTLEARERMKELGVSVQDAMRALLEPASATGSREDTFLHEADGVKVVVDIATREVLTVTTTKES